MMLITCDVERLRWKYEIEALEEIPKNLDNYIDKKSGERWGVLVDSPEQLRFGVSLKCLQTIYNGITGEEVTFTSRRIAAERTFELLEQTLKTKKKVRCEEPIKRRRRKCLTESK